ncbi:transglutaminase-like domain-containing protein [Anatilimnocola sp. NA78]|uniref:transglutaminase-like domain-containing protein n=1 Tax=Anatilimnocola sp. NA78 TaxID=3415683 RepID=UPI003CE5BF1E
MKLTTVLLLALLLTSADRFAGAEELRLSASEIFSRATVQNLQLARDGKSLELQRGYLIENDGNAAGYSYKPNEELLRPEIAAVQILKVPLAGLPILRPLASDDRFLPPRAYLLVGHSGKALVGSINGQPVDLSSPQKAGNYWKKFEIPPKVLLDGGNKISLTGDGKLWIARRDERSCASPAELSRPQQSYQLTKDVPPFEPTKLGPKNDIEGEYYVRLYLDGYAPASELPTSVIRLPTIDVANLHGKNIAPQRVKMRRVSISLDGDFSELPGPSITVSHRNRDADNTAPQPSFSQLGTVFNLAEDSLARHLDIEIAMPPISPDKSSRLRGIQIIAEVETIDTWTDKIKLLTRHNPSLPERYSPFPFESLDHPRLQQLRQQYQLDDVVKGCQTDLERMAKLAVWSSQLWTKGHLSEAYPKWDALEILQKHADGTPVGGFCQQYNLVFLQACESLGMPGRCVSIGSGDHGLKIRSGHEVVEIWSNELNQWIYVDGQAAWYFVDQATRRPLSLLELRERQVAHFQQQPFRAAEVVVLAKSPYEWRGFGEFPAFAELRMIPHTQFLDGKLPLPLNQGMRGWFWTGHHVWTDDKYPASILYPTRITREQDWNFPINQTHLWLEQQEKPGEVSVRLTHNMPSFAHFVLQLDEGPEKILKGSDFTWSLRSGENRWQARAVNKFGLRGPASWIKVSYLP